MKRTPTARTGTRSLIPDPANPANSNESSPWRRAKIAGVGFTIVLVLGLILSNFTGGGSASPESGAQASPDVASSPGGSGGTVATDGRVKGIPVGYPRSKDGALTAAVNYEVARSSPSYFTDRAFRHAVLDTMMTRESVSAQKRTDDQDASKLVSSLGLGKEDAGRMIMRAAPMGTQLSSYSPAVATVRIWMSELVGMTSADSPLPVSANWTTYTLTLQWQRNDWKLADISQASGPTPLQTSDRAPDSVDAFRKMDEDFNAPHYVG